MKKSHSIIVLVLMTVVAIFATTVIYNDYFNEEGDVYLAFLSEYKNTLHDVAFLSSPITCKGATQIDMPEASPELFSRYKAINGSGSEPINLRALEGLFNVVAFEDAVQTHKNNSQAFRPTSKRLIKLSRVAFDSNKTHALFCIEPGGLGDLVYLVKANGAWKVVKVSNVWIS